MNKKFTLGAALMFAVDASAETKIDTLMVNDFQQQVIQVFDFNTVLMLVIGLIGIIIINMHRI